MKKVEQISKNGVVVPDFDQPVKKKEIASILGKYGEVKDAKNPINFKYKNKELLLGVKAVTYLGHPHPEHKKRIQIPKEWKSFLIRPNSLLLGIYRYKNNVVFVLFNKHDYVGNRLNNSSAHVHTIDIIQALNFGIFKKEDKRGNLITVFTEDNFSKVFDSIIEKEELAPPEEVTLFDVFSGSIIKKWNGKKAYMDMLENNFSDALQAEWPGFYLEFLFSNFLEKNKEYKKICEYVKNKKAGGLDLDLYFHKGYMGDLKTHQNKSAAVLGNDKRSFVRALNRDKKIWYVVYSLDASMDKTHEGEVTEFWNKKLNELRGKNKKPNSYIGRMKHSVDITSFSILEINKSNLRHVSDFNQGLNPGGHTREVKIKINSKDIDNFVIHRKKF